MSSRPLNKHAIFLLLVTGLWAALPRYSTALEPGYKLVISKSEQQLSVVMNDKVIKEYRIAFGKGGKGTKRRLGDKKTPVGVYKIIDFKDDSRFHYFMQLDYPNLLDAWYGYKNSVISAREFKAIANAFRTKKKPPQDTKLGGYIGIHGLGETNDQKLMIHNDFNWTQGCIAITNEQINDLRQYVTIGTQVIIEE
ncbi:MAG TPA: L,D-transpeptidase [Gammaproteobacteria bacterium]|nr:L,D-transpeptidase [Gammaproteobacteria bacterium]